MGTAAPNPSYELRLEGPVRKFLVQNLSEQPVRVNTEPWADQEILAPEGRMIFEYEEPAEVALVISKNNRVVVDIASDLLIIKGPSGERFYRINGDGTVSNG
jgi:hypothetical protein